MKKQKPKAVVEEPGLDESVLTTRWTHPPQWLSLANVARYLGLSSMSITRYVTEENYKHLNFPQPSVLVDKMYWSRDDLDAWMRSRVGAVSTRKSRSAA